MVEDTIVQDNESKPSETAAKPGDSEPKAAFSIDILRLIRNAQKQHGLRHGDYQRYRGLCFFYVCLRMSRNPISNSKKKRKMLLNFCEIL